VEGAPHMKLRKVAAKAAVRENKGAARVAAREELEGSSGARGPAADANRATPPPPPPPPPVAAAIAAVADFPFGDDSPDVGEINPFSASYSTMGGSMTFLFDPVRRRDAGPFGRISCFELEPPWVRKCSTQ